MAITWSVPITNVNTQTKRTDVSATRTDSSLPTTPAVYFFSNTPIGTAAERLLLLNSIKAAVVADAARVTTVQGIVTDLEQAGKTALETWEGAR